MTISVQKKSLTHIIVKSYEKKQTKNNYLNPGR